MFRLLRSLTMKQFVAEQLPALLGAALIAETSYKFHSFLLEAGAFLATWCVLDALVQGVVGLVKCRKSPSLAPPLPQA
jgi:hypothetical protein